MSYFTYKTNTYNVSRLIFIHISLYNLTLPHLSIKSSNQITLYKLNSVKSSNKRPKEINVFAENGISQPLLK